MEGMRVLHVGTGTGYYTAILAELAGESGSVVGVEYEEDLAELSANLLGRAGYTTVTVRQGDGTLGVPEAAPFDRIMISAGAGDISPAWISQLADEGRLVVPLCHAGPAGPTVGGGAMLTVDKGGDTLSGHITDIAFSPPLKGVAAPTEEEGAPLADGLMRWFALSEFLRTSLCIRIVMRSEGREPPNAGSVPWYLETRSATMWVEPN
jgi:SAM-dependent methyltransferase